MTRRPRCASAAPHEMTRSVVAAVCVFALAIARAVATSAPSRDVLGHVVPGKVFPTDPQTGGMKNSTIAMVCNSTGPVDAQFAATYVRFSFYTLFSRHPLTLP